MKKRACLVLVSLMASSQTYAFNDLLNGISNYFSNESACARKVKSEIKNYERAHPGQLQTIQKYKNEVERFKQMEQLKKLAIEQAKKIQSENNGNLTLDSFFASDKPLEERMLDRGDSYHPVTGVPINEIIASDNVEVIFNADVSDNPDPAFDRKLESRTRTWYDIEKSSNEKLVLNIDFDKPQVNCSYEPVDYPVYLFETWEEAVSAYDNAQLAKEALEAIGQSYADASEEYFEPEFDKEGERYRTIDGEIFAKECDQHPYAPSGRIKVSITKDSEGNYQYETMVGETNLVDVYDNSEEHEAEKAKLAEIGFVKVVEGYEGEERKRWFNGMVTPEIISEEALINSVKASEIAFDEYFENQIGGECYAQFKSGIIDIPWSNGETHNEREKYHIVGNLNRNYEEEREEVIADGGANPIDPVSIGSY